MWKTNVSERRFFYASKHMFLLTVIKIVHIVYYRPYFLFQRISNLFQISEYFKKQISFFRGFAVYSEIETYYKSSPKPLDLET